MLLRTVLFHCTCAAVGIVLQQRVLLPARATSVHHSRARQHETLSILDLRPARPLGGTSLAACGFPPRSARRPRTSPRASREALLGVPEAPRVSIVGSVGIACVGSPLPLPRGSWAALALSLCLWPRLAACAFFAGSRRVARGTWHAARGARARSHAGLSCPMSPARQHHPQQQSRVKKGDRSIRAGGVGLIPHPEIIALAAWVHPKP